MANLVSRIALGAAVVALAPFTVRLAQSPTAKTPSTVNDKQTAAGVVTPQTSTKQDKPTPESQEALAEAWAQRDMQRELCGFLQLYANGAPNADGTCAQPAEGSVQAIIAILPDPVHTHLALRFDRAIDDVQISAQELGWTFDTAWMPWFSGPTPDPGRYSERAVDYAMLRGHENQPGLIMFRGNEDQKPLVVLVVGDTPTAGVDAAQFNTAAKTWTWLRPAMVPCPHYDPMLSPKDAKQNCSERHLMILGPTFTGSSASMKELLRTNFSQAERCGSDRLRIVLASGTMTSFKGLGEVGFKCDARSEEQQTAAYSFAADFAYEQANLLSFLKKRLSSPDEKIADLTEEESAFGESDGLNGALRDLKERLQMVQHSSDEKYRREREKEIAHDKGAVDLWEKLYGFVDDASGRPSREPQLLHLTFPRGISLLRNAYEKNGVSLAGSSKSENDAPKTELRLNFAEDARDEDTVTPYSGVQGAASMESRMAEIASTLEREKVAVVLLSATDVLDNIFVARYLQSHAPSVTIVIQDADVLFLRGEETALDGVYVVSPYPLIPRDQVWTLSKWSGRRRPSLPPSQGDQGMVNAVRYLLCGAGPLGFDSAAAPASCKWQQRAGFVSPYLSMPEYEPPFPTQIATGKGDPENDAKLQPPLWLSVISRGTFQPITLVDLDHHDQGLPESSDLNLPRLGLVETKPDGTEVEVENTRPWGIASEPLVQLKVLVLLISALCLVHIVYCMRARLDRTFAWSYASADANPWIVRVVIFVAMNLLGIYALSFVLPHKAPGFDLWRPGCAFVVIGSQILLVFASGLAAWRGSGSAKELHHRHIAIGLSFAAAAGFCVLCDVWLWHVFAPLADNLAERNFFFYRAAYPLCGASPTLPLLLLLLAITLWIRGRLAKMVFYGYRIPRLPSKEAMSSAGKDNLPSGNELRCPSQCRVAPLNVLLGRWLLYRDDSGKLKCNEAKLGIAFIAFFLVGCTLLTPESPLLVSLAHTKFDLLISGLAIFTGMGVVHNLLMAWKAWSLLRTLVLIPLKQSPLRWGFNWIRGFSWKRLWTSPESLSPENQLEYVMRNVEADRRGFPAEQEALTGNTGAVTVAYRDLLQEYADTQALVWTSNLQELRTLAERESMWSCRVAVKLGALYSALAVECEQRIGTLAGKWRLDRGPLTGPEPERGLHNGEQPTSDEGRDRMADEEFVAMVYLSYIRSVLVQIRNRIATSAVLYVLLLWSLTSYPWMDRHRIFLLMCALLTVLAVVAITIYSDMQRDDILSRTTSTTAGKLDGEFVVKILSVVGIPLLTLIASQFPEFGNAVFSWLEPGLTALR